MFLSLFSSLFCQTPFAGLLLRQGESLQSQQGTTTCFQRKSLAIAQVRVDIRNRPRRKWRDVGALGQDRTEITFNSHVRITSLLQNPRTTSVVKSLLASLPTLGQNRFWAGGKWQKWIMASPEKKMEKISQKWGKWPEFLFWGAILPICLHFFHVPGEANPLTRQCFQNTVF